MFFFLFLSIFCIGCIYFARFFAVCCYKLNISVFYWVYLFLLLLLLLLKIVEIPRILLWSILSYIKGLLSLFSISFVVYEKHERSDRKLEYWRVIEFERKSSFIYYSVAFVIFSTNTKKNLVLNEEVKFFCILKDRS